MGVAYPMFQSIVLDQLRGSALQIYTAETARWSFTERLDLQLKKTEGSQEDRQEVMATGSMELPLSIAGSCALSQGRQSLEDPEMTLIAFQTLDAI